MAQVEFSQEVSQHRGALLRHCYRMMGSFPDAEDIVQDVLLKAWKARERYVPEAPLVHWLMRIATTSCLTALANRRRRGLPQLDGVVMDSRAPLIEAGSCSWVTAVLDVNLFERPDQAAESREQVGIAFIALLQRLPPKQRAALLLKDVLGWDAEDIAATLDVSVAGVNSALHRARETMARVPLRRADEPNVELVRAYVKSWENRDLDGLVALLKRDVVLAMPPFASWVTGAEAVRDFFQRPDFIAFWSRGVSGKIVRANGGPAIAWYVPGTGNRYRPHALELQRWEGGLLAESIHFVGGAT